MGSRYRKNLNVLLPCFVVLGIMFGLVAYAPELYRAFCGATGYGGTTQRAYSDPTTTSDKTVAVAFDSNVAPGLPWRFEPEQRSVTVHLGEQKLVFFTAENLSNESIVGHAAFNVTPETSGVYFNKIQCFCFNEERLDPHQKVEMPVVFFVDPAFAKDPDNLHVDTITLSYTFFARRIPHRARTFHASWPMPRRIPPTASSSSPNGARHVMRWMPTRPAPYLAVWWAAGPARRPDTTIRRH
ncbi:cytochrome c oxidase assembly protein [Bradyrhizobium sp. ISRA463]|uniref:cytochrome c oxidase assembly protein n=1 Tax=Bradyrhizobium sp. ISRA463 TaxID=2866199 RepID=UPI00247837AC|nr:cytochrome c oxidase assembly protein [Bradyrhizobium sp. ISRA463]WGS21534.1 cytochrome c oxidase assembly protein [Bradyrhizobium sp. ISRA463]